MCPSDLARSRKTLHDLLRAGHLPGLLLPGQPDLGRGGHGLRRAEPGDHRGGSAEGGGVPGHAGAAEETAGGGTGRTFIFVQVRIEIQATSLCLG